MAAISTSGTTQPSLGWQIVGGANRLADQALNVFGADSLGAKVGSAIDRNIDNPLVKTALKTATIAIGAFFVAATAVFSAGMFIMLGYCAGMSIAQSVVFCAALGGLLSMAAIAGSVKDELCPNRETPALRERFA